MGAQQDRSDEFVGRLSEAFHRVLFQPMFQNAAQSPADVRRLIAVFRDKLDMLDAVIETAEHGGVGSATTTAGRSAAQSSPPPQQAADSGDEQADNDDFDEIGRNQRSRVREMYLLEAMARETRPYSLQQLLAALAQKGFADSSGAVVSQLHRLKKLKLINQPVNGMYEITTDGLGHLRKLRASFGPIVGDGR